MNEKEHFYQAAGLLILLTVISMVTTENIYILMLLSGVMIIFLTLRSLSDEECGLLWIVLWTALSVTFAVLSCNVISYIIFNECRYRIDKYKLRAVLPMFVYVVVSVIQNDNPLWEITFNALILFVVTAMLCIMEHMILNYMEVKDKIGYAVKITAINEMHEKKLNRELIIKNYLADKNARLEERENISRNIHNSVGHSITAAIMTLDAADMLFDKDADEARKKMNTANERIRTSLDSIRHAVRVLDGEAEAAYISVNDFVAELIAVSDDFMMDTMIKVYLDYLEADMGTMILREHTEFMSGALKELLSNGVRHGGADIFFVWLAMDSRHIRLKVMDNGRSDFSNENSKERIQNGFGLKKIVSYVRKWAGMVEFSAEGGFRTEIILPIVKEKEDE